MEQELHQRLEPAKYICVVDTHVAGMKLLLNGDYIDRRPQVVGKERVGADYLIPVSVKPMLFPLVAMAEDNEIALKRSGAPNHSLFVDGAYTSTFNATSDLKGKAHVA